jgi:hypothetical protein
VRIFLQFLTLRIPSVVSLMSLVLVCFWTQSFLQTPSKCSLDTVIGQDCSCQAAALGHWFALSPEKLLGGVGGGGPRWAESQLWNPQDYFGNVEAANLAGQSSFGYEATAGRGISQGIRVIPSAQVQRRVRACSGKPSFFSQVHQAPVMEPHTAYILHSSSFMSVDLSLSPQFSGSTMNLSWCFV